MIDFDADQHNMNYLDLDKAQYKRHCELMRQSLSDWPPALYAQCEKKSKIYGFSGDGLAVWVAEWIKNQYGPGF